MYECDKAESTKKARPVAAPFAKTQAKLLFLVVLFALGRRSLALNLSLRFRLFHGFLGFGSLLGASFGTLLFLLVEDLLAAQQFEKSLVGAVTLIPVSADDARVPAIAIAKPRPDRVEQLHHGRIGHEISRSQTPRREISALAQRNHLLDDRLRRLGLGNSRLNALLHDHRGDQ